MIDFIFGAVAGVFIGTVFGATIKTWFDSYVLSKVQAATITGPTGAATGPSGA